MLRATLTRWHYGKTCTIGILRWGNDKYVYTMEDGWHGNSPMISCIPDGEYLCRPRMFYKGGYEAFEITGVPNRSTILIHRGNTADDVTGCVVVGMEVGSLGNKAAVLNSSGAWARFFPEFMGKEFILLIKPENPLPGTV